MGIKPHPSKQGHFIVSISKRPPVDTTGKRQPITMRREAKSKAEANRIYRELVVAVDSRINGKTFPTWATACHEFYEYSLNRGIQPKTVKNYKLCLQAHTFEHWGDTGVNLISTSDIRKLLHSKKSLSTSHQKNILKFIRAVFTYLTESRTLDSNPTPQMRFRTGDKVKKVLTEEQLNLFLSRAKEIDSEWYPHWVTAAYTGMRNGELYALTWDKVDLKTKKIIIDCAWNNVDGFKSTKSGHERIVSIAPPLLSLLKELKLNSSDSVYVLPRIDKWDRGEQARDLRMFLTGIGLPTIRFHDLRASWATLLLKKGVEPVTLMKIGGWRDMKTMMYYVRMSGVDIEGATDCLNFHDPKQALGKVLNLSTKSD